MLIPSNRLGPGDLDAWGAWSRTDRLLSMRRETNALIRRSCEHIERFGADEAYVSCSWGKDSTVTAWLVRNVLPDVPIVWFRWPLADPPESEAVRDAFLAALPGPYEEHAATSCADFYAAGGVFARGASGRRRFTGIRSAESASREMSALVHGVATKSVCRPLLHWSAHEVYAALDLADLPVHPNYAMSRAGTLDRDWLRVDVIGGETGTGMGRREWERHYYSDVLNRVLAASG